MSAPATFSVCVPYGGNRPDLLRQAVASAVAALPADAELLVVADGAGAAAEAAGAGLDERARIIGAGERGGLVATWNRCLTAARGDLVHLLHDDDAVRPGFYDAVAALRRDIPGCALYATGFAYFGRAPDAATPEAREPASRLRGNAAASFLLRQGGHVCGSVVLTREAVERGGFDAAFPSCPDEEAYLRWASEGGLAYDPRPLYLERMHDAQERYRTWRRPDFVGTYLAARITGARAFGAGPAAEAECTSAANVTRIAIRLAAEGEPLAGAARLDELRTAVPSITTDRTYRIARTLCGTVVGRAAIRVAGRALWLVFRARHAARRRRR